MKRTVVLVVLLAGCSGKNDNPAADRKAELGQPIAKLTAVVLFSEYDDNAIAADGKYLDQTLEVTGTVNVIESDRIGFAVVGDSDKPSVICRIEPGNVKEFASWQKDRMQSVVGRCRGVQKKPGAWQDKVIILDRCRPAN